MWETDRVHIRCSASGHTLLCIISDGLIRRYSMQELIEPEPLGKNHCIGQV